MKIRFPAEWEEQDGILLAWPHADTDWAPLLAAVEPVFVRIATEVSYREQVLIIVPEAAPVRSALEKSGADAGRVMIVELPTNDTWARDFGPLTIYEEDRPVLLDFGFNGWGLKFASDQDNQATRRLARLGVWGTTPCRSVGLVLEGEASKVTGRGPC